MKKIRIRTYRLSGDRDQELFFDGMEDALKCYVEYRNRIPDFWNRPTYWPTVWIDTDEGFRRVHDFAFEELSPESLEKYLAERIIDTDGLLADFSHPRETTENTCRPCPADSREKEESMENNTVIFENTAPYDVDFLREHFCDMSQDEILAEYARILNTHGQLNRAYSSGRISFDDFSSLMETWDEAGEFLSGYLALCYMESSGYCENDDIICLLTPPPDTSGRYGVTSGLYPV